MEYLVLLRTVDADVLGRTIVGDLRIEGCQFRDFDEVAEPLFLYDLVGYGELVVDGLLGEDGRPRVERADVLPLQLFRTQVFEQQIQLRQGVGNGRAGEERSSQIAPRALLYGTQGEEHVECPLRPVGVTQSRHAVVARGEGQVLEFVALVHVDMVDAHQLKIHRIVLTRFERVHDGFQLGLQIHLALDTPFEHGA